MESRPLANLANYEQSEAKKQLNELRLGKALDTIAELLNIEYGSVTVHFHRGSWSPKIEILKSIFREIKK